MFSIRNVHRRMCHNFKCNKSLQLTASFQILTFLHLHDRFGITTSQICMVGDRLDTDILFGQNGGCKTLLVLSGFINSSVLTLIHALGCLLQVWLPCRRFRAPTTRSSKISTQIKSQIFSPSKQQLSEWRSPPSICICSIEHFFVTDKETQRIVLFFTVV